MYPHMAKVMPKARLEESARRRIQWLAGRAQDFMNNRRHSI
jgi:hypothetical protein